MDYKSYIDILSAALIPVIAIITTYIAIQQFYTNKLRLKHEMYDRRIKIYLELLAILGDLLKNGDAGNDEFNKLYLLSAQFPFIFKVVNIKYIHSIHDNMNSLHTLNTILKDSTDQKERERSAKKKTEIMEWARKQVRHMEVIFSSDLKLF
jgi:hypothetical protein